MQDMRVTSDNRSGWGGIPLIHFGSRLIILSFLLLTRVYSIVSAVEERREFDVPLARLSVMTDNLSGRVDEVFISYDHYEEGWAITRLSDRYVKDTRRKREERIYQENKSSSYLMTAFEAEQISRVIDTFIEALEVIESDLRRRRWGRILYLDSYLASFMNGFYHLISEAYASREILSPYTCIPDYLYDKSLVSPKSDNRIHRWQQNEDTVVKLRIVTRELIAELQKWQERELDNPDVLPSVFRGEDFAEVYELFSRLYFNMEFNAAELTQ